MEKRSRVGGGGGGGKKEKSREIVLMCPKVPLALIGLLLTENSK